MSSITPSDGYVIHIPRAFLDSLIASVSPRAVCVYLILEGYRGKDGTCFPGVGTISEKAKCSERHVKRALAELVKVGAIARKRVPNRPNVYILERPPMSPPERPPMSPPERPPMSPEDIPVLTDTSSSHIRDGVVCSLPRRDSSKDYTHDPCQSAAAPIEHATPEKVFCGLAAKLVAKW